MISAFNNNNITNNIMIIIINNTNTNYNNKLLIIHVAQNTILNISLFNWNRNENNPRRNKSADGIRFYCPCA